MTDTLIQVSRQHAEPEGIVEVVKPVNAITATNTPVAVPCAGAKKIAIQLTEAGSVNNRSGVLTITVSLDGGTTFQAYSMLVSNAANTNGQTLTRVASITRASAGTDICFLTPETLGAITHIKTTVTITDGATPAGIFTVIAAIQY
ncbi:MAG: hypothetical protein NT155_03715 [Candidatus Staskawiczbacteria bacterium]|nr:hypothetical protein [Candidatus Staskawiczbacteria bacterium]